MGGVGKSVSSWSMWEVWEGRGCELRAEVGREGTMRQPVSPAK